MKLPGFLPLLVQQARQRPLVAASLGLALLLLLSLVLRSSRAPVQNAEYHVVQRGDFLISVVEGGNIDAVNEVQVRSEVEGTARIIFIVPEGTEVKQGDLLVELDSSSSQDAVNQQQINVEKAEFAYLQAKQQLDIQKSVVESELASLALKVEFAQSSLEKYVKGEALQARRNAQIEITNVLESLQIAGERLGWSEELYKQGYETKANLDKDRLTVSQSTLRLEQARQALWLLETYDEPKRKRELEAGLKEAQDNLEHARLQGERKLAQYEADVATQSSTLELTKKKLERDMKQLQATKIHAPTDGLVVYANSGGHFSSESLIEEGAVVRNRQEIIKLPDVADMKLSVKIHESHINQIRLGQPAYVVLDSMPDRRFAAHVNKVAPLPDSQSRYGNPNLKVYTTEVVITEPLPNVKPGVSARAEIVITNLQNVLTVPIQAVTTRQGKQVAYLAENPPRPVSVQVGMYNTKFIEVASGLKEGDRVLLAPPFDTQQQDLSGAVLADGEKVTNAPVVVRPDAAPRVGLNGARRGEGENGEAGGPRGAGGFRGDTGVERGAGGPRPGGLGTPEDRGTRTPRSDFGGERTGGPRPDSAGEGERGAGAGRPEGMGGTAKRTLPPEVMKQFDLNGDGTLDETEQAALRERFRGGGRRAGGTNTPAGPPPGN